MKLAITEYNFGGNGNQDLISAALAHAEVMAIFGREDVYLGTRWAPAPNPGSKLEDAFRLFLNYDSQGSSLHGDSVRATTDSLDDVTGTISMQVHQLTRCTSVRHHQQQ